MNKKTTAKKIIIAIASILGILPAIAASIDVIMSSLVHLVYSAWFHIHIIPSHRFTLPALIFLCCLGILYSFNLQLKIKEDPGIHDFVFPPLFFAGGIGYLVAAADIYFSRAANYTNSAIFHINVHEYRIGPLCFIAIFPFFIALFIYMIISQPIYIIKYQHEEADNQEL